MRLKSSTETNIYWNKLLFIFRLEKLHKDRSDDKFDCYQKER